MQRLCCLVWFAVAALLLVAHCASAQQTCPGISENTFDDELADIEWIHGKDDRTVEVVFAATRNTLTLFRSLDEGKNFTPVSEAKKIWSITKTSDPSTVYFLGLSSLYVTTDKGKTFQEQFKNYDLYDFQPHPDDPTKALALTWSTNCFDSSAEGECQYELFLLEEYGAKSKSVAKYVSQFTWGNESNTILYTSWPESVVKGKQQYSLNYWDCHLYVSHDVLATPAVAVMDHVGAILMSGDNLWVAIIEDKTTQELGLLRSLDDGRHFDIALFPKGEEVDEKRYTLLEVTDDATFVNVDHSDDAKWGTVYTTNGRDTRFTESLPYNVRSVSGGVDFRPLSGLSGIYLANQYIVTDPEAGPSDMIHTLISYDQGAQWRTLTPPSVDSEGKTIVCEDCTLNLFGNSQPQHPQIYSTETAIGLIISAGVVGPLSPNGQVSSNPINTYFSRDAGVTWSEVAKGPHIYDFANHGSLILIADASRPTKDIKYSMNQGLSWQSCQISSTEVSVINILTEPTNTGLSFLVYGRRAGKAVLIHIDFKSLHMPECGSNDYETFSPDPSGDKCFMGAIWEYTRRKADSACFNKKLFESSTLIHSCPCKREDYECDYCYRPVVEEPGTEPVCELACPGYEPSEPYVCEDVWHKSQGYRKLSGNHCTGKDNPEVAKYEPIETPCQHKTDGDDNDDDDDDHVSAGKAVFFIFFFLVMIGLVAGFIFFIVALRKSPSFARRMRPYVPGFLLPDTITFVAAEDGGGMAVWNNPLPGSGGDVVGRNVFGTEEDDDDLDMDAVAEELDGDKIDEFSRSSRADADDLFH
ncbi:hypothetical protein QOT17_010881 [Balamuthia mandrillaris]